MGSWWRSEEMTYVSIIFSDAAASSCIRELGALGCIQFTDLNPELTPFQRRYVAFIKRCDEIERKIRYVNGEVKKMGVPIQPAGSVDAFVSNSNNPEEPAGNLLLESLESKLDAYEQQLTELNKYSTRLMDEYIHKVEFHHLLIKSRKFLGEATNIQRSEAELGADNDREEQGFAMTTFNSTEERGMYHADDMTFSNIAGVLPTADRVRFERMLYRSTRGNCYVRFSVLSDRAVDSQGKYIDKVCFIIFYKSSAIEVKVKRICDAFSANRYDLSNLSRPQELEYQQKMNHREMLEAKAVLDKNTETRLRLCVDAAANLEEWMWMVRREKGVFHTLNLFKNDVAGNLLRGRGWIKSGSIATARNALKKAHALMNMQATAMMEPIASPSVVPPTHFETNKFTYAFQEFVNTYGVPRYREINPALFTAATFPFLFGVMYGDIGHGSILAMAGLYLILTESRANERGLDEMVAGIYSARYMLFAMGLMAVYAGLVYNDYFSIGLDLFRTRYTYPDEPEDGEEAERDYTYGDPAGVYPFGVDPAWKISGNELLFFNSMKMKMSVILGIVQMTVGIMLKGINAFHFKQYRDLYCEFLPMILFDLSLFGYMVCLIFVKWSIDWNDRMAQGTCGYDENGVLGGCSLSTSSFCFSSTGNKCDINTPLADVCPLDYGGTGDGCQPPNLITTLINIALKPGSVEEPMFYGQSGLQSFLLFVAFICVPWLLCLKPYLLYREQKEKKRRESEFGGAYNPLLADEDDHSSHGHTVVPPPPAGSSSSSSSSANKTVANVHEGGEEHHKESHGGEHHEEEHGFGEIVIHQAIETIEFVLGMVSNTASYLRLWALSLAHTELAAVFWEKALLSMIETNNPVLIFFGYAVFAGVTFGVLLCMDVLECFLHALRLHWVEFQSKFYKADGYRFTPFDFTAIIDKAVLE